MGSDELTTMVRAVEAIGVVVVIGGGVGLYALLTWINKGDSAGSERNGEN